jgi:hypothetical protein
MTQLEGHRESRESGTMLFDRPPAARALERDDGSLPALSERISSLAETVRARFDQSLPSGEVQQCSAASGDQSLPVISATPASSLPVIVGVFPSDTPAIAGGDVRASEAVAFATPLTGVHVDLRSNAAERFRDLTERLAWPEAEPDTEQTGDSEKASTVEFVLQSAGPVPLAEQAESDIACCAHL